MSYFIELDGTPLCAFKYRGVIAHQWGREIHPIYQMKGFARIKYFSIPEQAQRFIDKNRNFCKGAVIREHQGPM